MKKLHLLLFLPLLLAACKQKDQTAATTKTDTVKYAYSIPKPDNWIIDTSNANTQVALNAVKAFENGDTAGLHKCIADSIAFNYDGGKYKGPVKGFLTLSKSYKDSTKVLSIKMYDWEPVVSKDGTEKWVTLWYKQSTTHLNGKTDSVGLVNDFLFKNGKIVRLDEYVRFLPK